MPDQVRHDDAHRRLRRLFPRPGNPRKGEFNTNSLVIDNHSHYMRLMALRLDQLPFRTPARVTGIDWSRLSDGDANRLRNLGFDEGVDVEALHGAPFGRDPLAVRIGRMMVAMRRAQARAICVETV